MRSRAGGQRSSYFGLAAQALDGSNAEVGSSADVQLEALVGLPTEALSDEQA